MIKHIRNPEAMCHWSLTQDKSPELELTALLSGYQSPQLTFMQSQCIYEEEVHDPKHYLFYFKHQCTSILWIIQDTLNFNVRLRSGSKIIMFKIQTEAVLEGIVRGRDNLWINECITKDFIIILFFVHSDHKNVISTEVKKAQIQAFSCLKKNSEVTSSVVYLHALQKDDLSFCLPLNLI